MKYLFTVISCLLISTVLAKPEITCEDETATMECKGKKVIQITKAFWGRAETDVCKPEAIPSAGCSSQNVFSRMQTMCNGKKKCEVKASNHNFGDPCWGPSKYMISDYKCVVGGSVDICEGDNSEISCPGKFLLEIGDAFYGRQTPEICDNVGVPLFGCDMGSAKHTASVLCNGQQKCTIPASNDFFGDPCWLVKKYAQVSYLCVRVNTANICEGDTKTLACPDGRKLQIRKATWGRSDSEVCAHAGVPSGGCAEKKANKMVKKECNKKNSCTLTGSNDVYGDPCWGTPKYLQVLYICK